MKVWVTRVGSKTYATPVTRGRRPKPENIEASGRKYGAGKNRAEALAALSDVLGEDAADFEVTSL